jgi:hypothetical protein
MSNNKYVILRTFPRSDGKGEWEVKTNLETGRLSCNCPIWIFNKQHMNGERWCSHLEQTVSDLTKADFWQNQYTNKPDQRD